MMSKKISVRIVFFLFFMILGWSCKKEIKNYTSGNRDASIFPDYINVVIPPNIAPLNFIINEKGNRYRVEIYSKNGEKMRIESSSPKIEIPEKKWHQLLDQNKRNPLFVDIYVKDRQWKKFRSIRDSIVDEKIDDYMVYRMVHAVYTYSRQIEVCQRDLGSFSESVLFDNASVDYACVNCHSFPQNDPSKMVMHVRKEHPGSVIYHSGKLEKVNTRTPFTMSGGVYPSWSPDGNYIAFAVLKMVPVFTSRKNKIIDLADQASDLVVYDVRKNQMTTSPSVSTYSRENMPFWSPDGKWIYYINAPEAKKGDLESLLHQKYDLMRISFDAASNRWGTPDTLLSSKQAGMSITFPQISPDGNYLVFTGTDYGYFTIYHQNSDLYILDLATREYRKMDVNSDCAESYHSWSSNSRWIVFSSKRLDKTYTRPFFAYVDQYGRSFKPFLLPQKDPEYYEELMANYNRPELVTGKVNLSELDLRDFIYKNDAKSVGFDPSVSVDALSGATKMVKKP